MTPLILAVDSGLDGAFVWMRGGKVLHHVLTRTLVTDGRIDMDALKDKDATAYDLSCIGRFGAPEQQIAYLEEPFNPGMTGRANSAGFAGSCKRFGRLQGWLESWGYEVRSVRPQEWQRDVLDLAKFEVRTEKECAPRLAEGWTLKATVIAGAPAWSLRHGGDVTIYSRREGQTRADTIEAFATIRPECTTATKSILSHDTKAASIAYAREHFPGVELVPPRCKNPHDGLADAICIAAWASKQLNKETP